MKKTLLFLLFFYTISNAQVKIGGDANIPLDDSEMLKIEASNKGLLIPNVYIPDLNQAPPVTNPADYLLVYNTNEANTKGFYYWENNKWNPIIDASNIYAKLRLIRHYSVESNGVLNDNESKGSNTYALSEDYTWKGWKQIPGVEKTIDLITTNNEIAFTVSGIVQRNEVYRPGETPGATDGDSYAIGIFVDGFLRATRGFILNGENCSYNVFNVQGELKGLSVGQHTFTVKELYRRPLDRTRKATLSFGANSPSCTNLNAQMARTTMNIQVVQQ